MPEPERDISFNRAFDRLVAERRSIRRYLPGKVPESDITDMAGCAAQMPAPSNRRPVRLVHIASPDKKEQIRKAMAAGFDWLLDRADGTEKPKKIRNVINFYWRFSEFMLDAPVLFAAGTVQETDGFTARLARAGILDPSAVDTKEADITTGIYLSALIHKAKALGLGTCILTAPLVFVRDMKGLAENIGLPGNLSVRAFVPAGYADETPVPPGKPDVEDILISI